MEYQNIKKISKSPLNEQVYQSLMNSIVNGSLLPGTELKEKYLAKQLNVSATPVREALRRLVSEGLVEIIPYRGAIVKILDPKEINEAYACREALERLVVSECVKNITDEEINRLYELIEQYKIVKDIDEFSEISREFDCILYECADNSILINLLNMLNGIISRDRKYSSNNALRRKEIYMEHKEIINALDERNVEAAKCAVSNHIHNGKRFIEQSKKME